MVLNSDERKIVEYLEKFEEYLRSDELDATADYIHKHIDFERTAKDLESTIFMDITKEYKFGEKYYKIYRLNDFFVDKDTLTKSTSAIALVSNIFDLFFMIELNGTLVTKVDIKFTIWAEAYEKFFWGNLE